MLSNNDLYDLSAVFKEIRSNILYEYNTAILKKLIEILENESLYEENQIRKALASIGKLEENKWLFVYYNNLYTYRRLLKDSTIYRILIYACSTLKSLFEIGDFEQADALVDSIHCLPEIIAENQFHIPYTYWKTYILPYRKRWNKTFLLSEEKEYRKKYHVRNFFICMP